MIKILLTVDSIAFIAAILRTAASALPSL